MLILSKKFERVDSRKNNHVKKGNMTREQVVTIFTDLGLEAPQKGVVNALLNAFNQEKSNEIETVKKTAEETVEAKYKGFVKPEDHQKIVDELNQEKGKAALNDRKAKYKAKNLNIDDEDILTLIDGKLKDSKDFDKDLEEYVKAHPGFVIGEQPSTRKSTFFQGLGNNQGKADESENKKMNDSIRKSFINANEE